MTAGRQCPDNKKAVRKEMKKAMRKGIHKAELILAILTAAAFCGCGKSNTNTSAKTDSIGATETVTDSENTSAGMSDATYEENTAAEATTSENNQTEEETFEESLKEQIEQEIQKNTPQITTSYAETEEYPELAEFLISYFGIPEEYLAESRYYYNYVDLNEDGTEEILALVVGEYTTGSGGDTVLLIEKDAENFVVSDAFYMVRTPVIVSDNMTNGWHDLIFPVYGGGNDIGYSICHYSEDGTYMSESNEFVEDLDDSISGHQILSNNLIDDKDKGTYLSLAPEAE